jgi:hypothetical protein
MAEQQLDDLKQEWNDDLQKPKETMRKIRFIATSL